MKLIDSHAHLTDERFAEDVEEVLDRALEAGVVAVVTIATNVDDSPAAAELARRHPRVFATAGIHPHSAVQASDDAFARLRELWGRPEVVAVGETGLDYFYDHSPRDVQRASFERHLEIGAELDLPVVVHARSADDDLAAALRSAPAGVKGVLHCFSSGLPLLETGLELGWFVSFAGMITFSRYEDAQLIQAVPLDRLLLETDSPYLAPAPHRSKRNEPSHLPLLAHRAAELRGEEVEEVAAATTRNAIALYGLEL